jgi:molybdopterin converting factor small subunit
MNQDQSIKIVGFGAYKKFWGHEGIHMILPQNAVVQDLRQSLLTKYSTDHDLINLLQASAFATDDHILQEHELINCAQVALLPPVCGG